VDDRHARNVFRDRRRVWDALPSTSSWAPGARAEEVAERLGLPVRVVEHHLEDLEAEGLVSRAGERFRRRGELR
jgi:predicted ArsR family transcriptional regulator